MELGERGGGGGGGGGSADRVVIGSTADKSGVPEVDSCVYCRINRWMGNTPNVITYMYGNHHKPHDMFCHKIMVCTCLMYMYKSLPFAMTTTCILLQFFF